MLLLGNQLDMVASIQLNFPFPVKYCLNISGESKKILFRHSNTTVISGRLPAGNVLIFLQTVSGAGYRKVWVCLLRVILFQRLLLLVGDWYEQCGCVGAWA